LGNTLAGHDKTRLEEYFEKVDLEGIDLKAINLEAVNRKGVYLEAVNLAVVDSEACAMEARTLWLTCNCENMEN
jgi:uncharacterized protein YjbI with pentapeptide repeats